MAIMMMGDDDGGEDDDDVGVDNYDGDDSPQQDLKVAVLNRLQWYWKRKAS